MPDRSILVLHHLQHRPHADVAAALGIPVGTAKSSVYSTPRDMARYVAALLGGGASDHGAVLKPATLAMMFAPQFQPDPRLPGHGPLTAGPRGAFVPR
jgi:CubicO group peptidase (beta-lactamase class C family)